MIHVETEIRIEQPIDEVFAYVSEPLNLPHWNSAVRAVRPVAGQPGGYAGDHYRMERSLPTGEAVNDLVVDSHHRPTLFEMHTTSGPTPFAYRFDFAPAGSATRVTVRMGADLGSAERLPAALLRMGVRRGVEDNLATLKRLVE